LNRFQEFFVFFWPIAHSRQVNSILKTLYLGDNNAGDLGASQIANSLKHNSTLTSLSLYNNNIGEQGVTEIANSLQHNYTLTYLHLAVNKVSDEWWKKIKFCLYRNEGLTKNGNWPKEHKKFLESIQHGIEVTLCCISKNFNLPKELNLMLIRTMLDIIVLKEIIYPQIY